MVRNRFLAAALLALPLAACGVDTTTETQTESADVGTLSTSDVKSALAAIPGSRVLGAHADGVPFMVEGDFGSAGQSLRGLSAREANAHVGEALSRIAPAFRLQAADLVATRTTVDAQGHTHIRYAQMKSGLRVVGGELIVHVDQDGRIYSANGSARDGETVSATARLSAEAAKTAALRATQGTSLAAESAQLVFYRTESDNRLKLAYEVVVTGEGVDMPVRDHTFVSARDGAILGVASDIHSALNRALYSANNGTSLPGTLKRSEGGAVTNDSHVDMNYDHLGTTYNCYKVNFNRDSYNAAGAQLKSTVHYSTNYVNAFWNGTQMVYGDGDGSQSGPLGKDLDVTVHELTHAVTDSESDLVYSNESGALNEGMSDIFAAYCESWVSGTWATGTDIWLIGEDIWTPATAGDALRYMANPTQDGSSKDYYPERYTGTQDNGGVHWNSGIANLAFKLLSTGGTHPRAKTTVNVTGIGVQKAGAIFYKANTDLMTSSTTFAQAKTYTEQAAEALYGTGAAEKASVTQAWDAVGVGSSTPPPSSCTTPVTLSNGVTVSNISVGTGAWSCSYTLSVPSGSTNLTFDLSGGTGDGDMYVKLGSEPTSSSYDCRPYKSGNTENCTFATPGSGTWYVKIYGYSSASGMSLKGAYSSGSTGNALTNGVATAAYSGSAGTWKCWTLNVPSGVSSVAFAQAGVSGTSGDADLYVRYGSAPTTSTYNCRPYLSGNNESCSISAPAAGTWYACSYGYSAYTGVTMKGTY